MTNLKRNTYEQAYCEVYEFIKLLTIKEQEKISNNFKTNLYNSMDKNYVFKIDTNKSILEQNYCVEAQAIIVRLYEKYLAPKNEKELWDKYDNICMNLINDKKTKDYNPDDLFNKSTKQEKTNNEVSPSHTVSLINYKEPLFKKILNKIKNFFRAK